MEYIWDRAWNITAIPPTTSNNKPLIPKITGIYQKIANLVSI